MGRSRNPFCDGGSRRTVESPLPDSNRRPLPYHGLKRWLRPWRQVAFSSRHAGSAGSADLAVTGGFRPRVSLVCHAGSRRGGSRRRRRAGALRRSGRRGRGGFRSDSDGSAGFVCSPGSLGGWMEVCRCRAAQSPIAAEGVSPSVRQVAVSRGALDVSIGVDGSPSALISSHGRRSDRARSAGGRIARASTSTCWRPAWARSSSAVLRREVWL